MRPVCGGDTSKDEPETGELIYDDGGVPESELRCSSQSRRLLLAFEGVLLDDKSGGFGTLPSKLRWTRFPEQSW